MTSLINPESIPRKTLTFFFVVENSASMRGVKMDTVNVALENYSALLRYYAAIKTEAAIRIAFLAFSSEARWITDEPVDAGGFNWAPLACAEDNGKPRICFDAVFSELNQKLSKNVFMASPAGALPPVILFFSTSAGAENDALSEESLGRLARNNWDKNALKLAFTLGKTANYPLLEKWTGPEGLTLCVRNPQSLIEFTSVAGRLCAQIATNSGARFEGNSLGRRLALKSALDAILKPAPDPIVSVPVSAARTDAIRTDTALSSCAVEYKNGLSKKFVSLNPSHIDDRMGGTRFLLPASTMESLSYCPGTARPWERLIRGGSATGTTPVLPPPPHSFGKAEYRNSVSRRSYTAMKAAAGAVSPTVFRRLPEPGMISGLLPSTLSA
jgi:hypothetical protein